MNYTKISRRNLLKTAGAALAAPYIIPGAALGLDGKASASERVVLAHIGVGGQGSYLFANFQNCQNAQSVAVADAYKDRRVARAAQCKGKAYLDYRELLAHADIDAVIIATPDHAHVPIAIAAARADKDAYVEKPLGLSIEQCLACRRVFDEKKRVFQYGTMQRSNDTCRQACEIVRNGKIGKINALEVIAPNGGAGGSLKEIAVPRNLDYNVWLGPAPRKPYTADRCNPPGSYWIYDYSIGYLAGWGAHPLDLMIWGSDADLSGPVTVEGTGVVADTSKSLYDTVYDWDMKLQLGDVPMTFKPGSDSTKFIGTEGWVRTGRYWIEAEPKSLLQWKPRADDKPLTRSSNHYQNFVDAVKSRKPAISPLDEAVRSDILSHLCNIAVRLKRKITWDPKAETIVGDNEAIKLLQREMGPGWTM
ncbi:MAG: Gfo/Idh/MocA family protein [Thermoguttaceae bacterium]